MAVDTTERRTVCQVLPRWIGPWPGCWRAYFLQRDAAFHGGLQASELIEDPDRALKDRLLDPGDLFTDPGIRFGRARCFGPVSGAAPT